MTTLPPDASPPDLPSPRGDDNDEAVAPPTSEQTLFVVGGPGESPPATGSADNDVAPPTDANTLLSLTRDAAIDASDLSAAFRNESHDPDTRLRRTRDALQGDGFDRYDIHREVGRGGMGVVLRAHDRRTRRDVAIKRMLDPVRGASAEMRFIQECQITAQLEHPGIVPVHDLGLDDRGRVFLSMKLVNGRSLQQRLTGALAVVRDAGSLEAAFPLAERLAVFRKVCDAVAFAHSRGTIHRDLKPDNVMIGAFGEVLVMDWGLARIIGSGETHREQLVLSDRHDGSDGDSEARTLDGAVAGTPAYMSPEQARGDISLLDQRTDVYALGAILYEMLTLTPPFRGRTSWEILSSVRSGKLEPAIERVRQEFGEAMTRPPRELEAVILRAMAFEREQRYADVPALAADIDAFLAGRAVGAADYSPLQLLAKWAARHRAPVITAAAAAVLLAAVAVVFVVNLRSAYETAVIERDRADHEATRASEQAARATDQASLAERRREEADSERAAADRQRIEALRALDAAIAFRASADDDTLRRIAWLSAGQSVRTRATAMTLTAPLFTHERMMTGQTEMRRIELTADGRSAVVVLNERHTLAVIDLDTFARRDLRLELDDNEAVLLALPDPAPGSDRAAIAVVRDSMKLTRPRPDDSRVVICSLTDGHQIRALPPAASYCSGLAFSPDGSLLGSCTQTAIRVVHTDTGEPVWQAAATGSSANLWFDPTGRIAAVCTGKQIEFRETASWGLLGAPVEGLRAFFYQPNPIALISIGSGSGKVDMWRVDASGDTPVVERMARVDGPFVIDALEPAGRLIVRENGGVRTYGWDGSNWTPSVALAPAVGGVDAARVAADGRLVVCGASGIETFRISTSPSHVLTLPADAADVTDGRHSGATTFSANGRWLAVELAHRLQDAAVCVYDFEAADPATAWRTIRIPAAIGAPVQVAFAPAADDDDDHESTLATLIGHVVELFDVRSGRSLMRADLGSGESMTAPVFVDGGDATWLAIGSDQGITLLDTRNNLAVRHTRTGIGTIMALAASPDGRWLVAIAKPQLDPVLHVMASADLVDVVTEAGDRPCGRSVAFSPDGQRVAVGDRFGVRVLDTATWQTVSRLPDDGLGTIAFSTDGTMLITNVHGNLHFSEAGTGSPLFSTHTPANGIGRLALCPDGRLLAHASGEESIWLTGGVVSADRDQATRQTGWVCDLSHLTLVPVASDVDAQLHERWPAPVLSRPDRVAAGFWRSYWKSVRAFRDLLPAHSGSAQTRPAPVAIPAGSLDAAVQPLAAWLAAHPDHPLASRARAMLATFAKGREVPPPFDW